LLGCIHPMISEYRTRAVASGLLIHVRPANHFEHKAATYLADVLILSKHLETTYSETFTRPLSPSSDLVKVSSYSETTEAAYSETSTNWVVNARRGRTDEIRVASVPRSQEDSQRCYVHGVHVDWWARFDGDPVCGRCHPRVVEAAI
jgi:hypothetical protein